MSRTRNTGAAGITDVPDWLYEHVAPTGGTVRELGPEQRLALAVIESAIDDLQRHRLQPGPGALCLWGHAIAWVRIPDACELGSFSFRFCVEALGLDADWIGESIIRAFGRRPISDPPAFIKCRMGDPEDETHCPIAAMGHRHENPRLDLEARNTAA